MKKLLIMVIVAVIGMTVTTAAVLKAEASDHIYPDFTEEESAMLCNIIQEKKVPLYSVNGEIMDEALQEWTYKCAMRYGIPEDIYPYWLAEIYAESGYRMVCENGRDYGYCQLRDTWHDWFKEEAGIDSAADLKTDVYANIQAGTWFFADCWLRSSGNHDLAIKRYFNSGDVIQDASYVTYVKSFFEKIERIN